MYQESVLGSDYGLTKESVLFPQVTATGGKHLRLSGNQRSISQEEMASGRVDGKRQGMPGALSGRDERTKTPGFVWFPLENVS